MDERTKFIARILEGDSMSILCDEFKISRKTGYKIWNRYQNEGVYGLTDRSRMPRRYANQLPIQIELAIVRIKKEKGFWGARKIRDRIIRLYPNLRPPSKSTVHAVLDRHGLVEHKKGRRRNRSQGTELSDGKDCNDLWCADYKGEFMLSDKRYCYPLTISDYASRFLISCEGIHTTKESFAFGVFERAFLEHGLPEAIRTDNGVPFASPNSLFNLSKLSVWWLRLGIRIERIKPGNPQQNGRHERMHLTLKKEATKPPGANFLDQQGKFDEFKHEYNFDRPHEALAMKYPGEVYKSSQKRYGGIKPLDYSMHDKTLTVTSCGRICLNNKKINFSTVFAGQAVGISEVHEGIWLVSFMDYDLGYFDLDSRKFEPLEDPFGSKVLPMS